jgi:hypothetical protein
MSDKDSLSIGQNDNMTNPYLGPIGVDLAAHDSGTPITVAEENIRLRSKVEALRKSINKREQEILDTAAELDEATAEVEALRARVEAAETELSYERENNRNNVEMAGWELSEHRRQLKMLSQQLAAQQAITVQMRDALRAAHHSLTCLHGLTASDGLREYGDALSNGCDPDGAWDCFTAETWKIDELVVLTQIDAALAKLEQP